MSRRRKRKKQWNKDNKVDQKTNVPSSPERKDSKTPEVPESQHSASSQPPAPSESIPSPKKPPAPALDEIDELDDDFEESGQLNTEEKISLPSPEDKKEIRTIRRTNETSSTDEQAQEALKENVPQKRQHLNRTAEKLSKQTDELGTLDDEELEELEARTPPIKSTPPTPQAEKPAATEQIPEPKSTTKTPDEPVEQISLKDLGKKALNSLSILEQVALGALILILVIAAIWSSMIVSSRIPNTVIASKLKFPLKGESVVIASLDTYWRSPIREGDELDKGVPDSIKIIPEVKLTLDPSSRSKSLRFIFRDEEGRFAGDSSTVRMSGAKFSVSDDVTAITKGNNATIRSTTGFQHEGELISYIADETFKWDLVILESQDGENYVEFMTIPISSNRKDKS